MSPKKQVADPGPESPLKWCRQALDHRSPETEMACRTLLSRLDQSKFTEAIGEKRLHMKTLASNQAPDSAAGQRCAIRAPAVLLFTAHRSFCVAQQTLFIINSCVAPAVGHRTSTTAILTPALNDNRK